MKTKIAFIGLFVFLVLFKNYSYSQQNITFTPEWSECLGNNNHYYECINNSILHSDGFIYCVGYSVSGVHDFLISKVSPITGTEVFSSTPYISASSDILHSVAESSDNTLVAVGIVGNHSALYPNYYGAGDLVIIRFKQDGQITNIKTFGGSKLDRAYSVVCNSDSTIVIAGKTASADYDFLGSTPFGGTDALVMKLDYNFNVIWQSRLGTKGDDCFNKVLKSRDGNYLCVGYSRPDTNNIYKASVMFSKISNTGYSLSTKYYPSTTDSLSVGLSIAEDTINGSLFIVGTDYDNFMAEYGGKSFIIKTNFNGTQLKRIDYAYKATSSFRDLVIIDDTLFIAGEVPLNVRKMGIYVFDEDLNNISQSGYLTVGSNDVPYSIIYAGNSFILSGLCYGSAESVNYWSNYLPTASYDAAILKVNKCSVMGISSFENKLLDIKVYPNPASDILYVENNSIDFKIYSIRIKNILGKELLNISHPNILGTTEISIGTLMEGMYLLNINNTYTIKFIKH